MVCSNDSGYATLAAAATCAVIAAVAAAAVARAGHELTAARAEEEAAFRELRLEGHHVRALARIIRDGGGARLAWRISDEFGDVRVLAEAEAEKFPSTVAAAPDHSQLLRRLGVPERARAGVVRTVAEATSSLAIMSASPARRWRDCARSAFSVYGGAVSVAPGGSRAPNGAGPQWRIGEIWRVRIADDAGWVDDRTVRFTGRADRPAAVIERDLYRGGPAECDALLKDLR